MSAPFHVAIVGGGLSGLALAISLTNHSIPYTIYEARASFSEYLGAGINLGPNSVRTLEMIDESLGETVRSLCSRNKSAAKENVWMRMRFGCPTNRHQDAELITDLVTPHSGNSTLGRNELLQAMASKAGLEHAKFNKKLTKIQNNENDVTIHFADGTVDSASVVVACDGVHSNVRKAILEPGDPAAVPHYVKHGGYRGVVDMAAVEQILGDDIAHNSNIFVGPGAYVIIYPMKNGEQVNVGLWIGRTDLWSDQSNWILPSQGDEMRSQFSAWGEKMHRLMNLLESPPFFAAFSHTIQPQSFVKQRIVLLGDACHSATPHQGAGAGQGAEDAFVMGEVLEKLKNLCPNPSTTQIEVALKAYEAVRRPRFERVAETSLEAFTFWTEFYRPDLTDEDVRVFGEKAKTRFAWIWDHDLAADAERARSMLAETMKM